MSDYDGRTPLHIASSEGNLPAMRYLLSNGAPVHSRDRYGRCSLDDALRFNHHEAIKLLREAGAHLMILPAKQGMMMCKYVLHNALPGCHEHYVTMTMEIMLLLPWISCYDNEHHVAMYIMLL